MSARMGSHGGGSNWPNNFDTHFNPELYTLGFWNFLDIITGYKQFKKKFDPQIFLKGGGKFFFSQKNKKLRNWLKWRENQKNFFFGWKKYSNIYINFFWVKKKIWFSRHFMTFGAFFIFFIFFLPPHLWPPLPPQGGGRPNFFFLKTQLDTYIWKVRKFRVWLFNKKLVISAI